MQHESYEHPEPIPSYEHPEPIPQWALEDAYQDELAERHYQDLVEGDVEVTRIEHDLF
jgi:hypothetical protein